MTLDQLRTLVRASIFDTQKTFLTDDNVILDAYINMAQHQVASMLASQKESELLKYVDVRVINPNTSGGPFRMVILNKVLDLNDNDKEYRVRDLIWAETINYTPQGGSIAELTDDDPSLKIIKFSDVFSERGDTASLNVKPPAFLFNQTVGFVAPEATMTIRLYFIRGVEDLIEGTDLCTLPPEYQPLIVAYAAILAIAAQNRSSPEQWWAIFQSMLDAMGLVMQRRMDMPGDE